MSAAGGRRLRGALHPAPASRGAGTLAGAALPGAPGLWCVLPPGAHALTVASDAPLLGVTAARVGAAPRALPVFPSVEGHRAPEVDLDLGGDDLARVFTVTAEPLDGAPFTLSARCGAAGSLSVRCVPGAPAAAPSLVGYRACGGDPIAFAAGISTRVEAILSLLAALGVRRVALTLSTRAEEPLRARVALPQGLSAELWTALLRALARGSVTSLTLEADGAELLVAPSPRGSTAAHETALAMDLARVPAAREAALRAAVEDAMGAGGALQAWCATLDEALRPRCVTRWERERGVRALPLEGAWLAARLRAAVRRAFIAGAWREGPLTAWHPRPEDWVGALRPDGASSRSPRVRALWRRTGGEPLQGGIA